MGEVKLSWLSSFPCKYVVEFEQGSIEGEIYYPQSVLLKTGAGQQKRVKLKSENYTALNYRIVDNFIKVISNGEPPLVPGSDILNSVRFTDECYAAAIRFEMPWYEILEVKND
jgi:predicted dehydrogenase